jgi:hypothetical protein
MEKKIKELCKSHPRTDKKKPEDEPLKELDTAGVPLVTEE